MSLQGDDQAACWNMRILYRDYILCNAYPALSGKNSVQLYFHHTVFGKWTSNQRQTLNIPIPHCLLRSGQWSHLWLGFSCPQEWWSQSNMDILRSKQKLCLPSKQTFFCSICVCSFFNDYMIWQPKKIALVRIVSRYSLWVGLLKPSVVQFGDIETPECCQNGNQFSNMLQIWQPKNKNLLIFLLISVLSTYWKNSTLFYQ